MQLNFIHHGAVRGVSGCCHQLTLPDGQAVLIDCGLFQGAETSPDGAGPDRLEVQFPIDTIRALIVTHVHIDHIGRIPYLMAAGFKGPIYCSEASALVLPMVPEDALKVGFTSNQDMLKQFIKHLKHMIMPLPYKQWHTVIAGSPGAQVRLQPAGHILGSAYVELDVAAGSEKKRVVFSGDLGHPTRLCCLHLRPPQRQTFWSSKAPTATACTRAAKTAANDCRPCANTRLATAARC